LEIVEHIADLPNTKSINVIYRPVWEELNEDYYNQFFEFCMKRRNCIIVIDEAMQVCPNPHRIPSWYKGALTRGMELQVGVWSLSQRPSTIPIVIISEATHIFVFKLNMLDDRKRIVKITGYSEFEEQAEKHHFWYFDVNKAQRPAYGTLKVKSLGTRS
jgi:hypothetical protein